MNARIVSPDAVSSFSLGLQHGQIRGSNQFFG